MLIRDESPTANGNGWRAIAFEDTEDPDKWNWAVHAVCAYVAP